MRLFSWRPWRWITLEAVPRYFLGHQEEFSLNWFFSEDSLADPWLVRFRTKEDELPLRKCSYWPDPELNILCNSVQCLSRQWKFNFHRQRYQQDLQRSFAYYRTFTSFKDFIITLFIRLMLLFKTLSYLIKRCLISLM